MSANENIEKQKIKLPEAKAPVGNYVATKISGKMLFISGQISIDENGQLIKRKLRRFRYWCGYNAAKKMCIKYYFIGKLVIMIYQN